MLNLELYHLKDYIKESCKFLGIEVTPFSEDVLRIGIPNILLDEFAGVREYWISFVRTSDPKQTYITYESFFTQKLAKLVAERNHGVSHIFKRYSITSLINQVNRLFPNCKVEITDKNQSEQDMLYIWCKTTIQSNLIEEYLKGFQFDFKTKTVVPLNEEISQILAGSQEKTIEGIEKEEVEDAVRKIIKESEKDAEQFVRNVTKQTVSQLQKEIQRITEYYDTLISENQLAETSKGKDSKEEIKLITSERESLIYQQKLKYSLTEKDITIEPVSLLFLRSSIENAVVHVYKGKGHYRFTLIGDQTLDLSCAVSGSREGAFTVTVDNLIVNEQNSFNCSSCKQVYDNRISSKCKVCRDSLCPSCKSESVVSKLPLCNSHALTCATCLESCAENEQHLCKHCNQFYCRNCNPGTMCPLCISMAPLNSVTPSVQRILVALSQNFKSKKYDYAEKGNRIALLGKGMLFKEFFLIYDKLTDQIIEMQEYGMFNKKK